VTVPHRDGSAAGDDALSRGVGLLIAQDTARPVDRELDAAERARFVSAALRAQRAGTRPREPRGIVVVLAAALVTVVVVSSWMLIPPRNVAYVIEGAATARGGFVQTRSDHDATIRFSDGSVVTLTPGARGRVVDVRERGARFAVETGTADVHVAKREGGADYVIDAGPYAVKVTGTRFTIEWDPASAHMHLDLGEGSVVITGPLADAGVSLRAGQMIDLDPSGVRVAEHRALDASAAGSSGAAATPSTATEAAVAQAPTAPVAGPSAGSGAPGATAASAQRAETWAERVAAGDFDSVLTDADRRGIEATLGSAPAGDLMTLADAARYGGRGALANDALRAVRRRFPGTKHASTAAFLLGRMAEDSGKLEAAISLYDATSSEGGTFAAEAMGRKMMLVKRRSGDAAARPIAERYLATYPRGAYADAARALVAR
jgi:hypothetical protein